MLDNKTLIHINNYVLKANKQKALTHKLKIKVKKGEVCFVRGHNGSGKSLLLKQLCNQKRKHPQIIKNISHDQMALLNSESLVDSFLPISVKALSTPSTPFWPKKKQEGVSWNECSQSERYQILVDMLLQNPHLKVIALDDPFEILDSLSQKILCQKIEAQLKRKRRSFAVVISHRGPNKWTKFISQKSYNYLERRSKKRHAS